MSLLNLNSKSVIAISIIRKMSSCLKVEKRKLVKKNLFCRHTQSGKNINENTFGGITKKTILRVFLTCRYEEVK